MIRLFILKKSLFFLKLHCNFNFLTKIVLLNKDSFTIYNRDLIMQTVKTLIIGLFIYGLSGIGISAKSLENPFYSDVVTYQPNVPIFTPYDLNDPAESMVPTVTSDKPSNPVDNSTLNNFVPIATPYSSNPSIESTPGNTSPTSELISAPIQIPTPTPAPAPVPTPGDTTDTDTDALSRIMSEMFVSNMFKNHDIYTEFLGHLHTSLSLNDNFKTLDDFLNTRCYDKCDTQSIFAVLEKLRVRNLFFWIGKYHTNLKFNDKGQTFTVFITNGAKVNNGKVEDGSVFINNIPIYNATFINRQLTWDYNTNLIQSNKSKGNLTFSDFFLEDSYIGHSFLGTLMVNSKITGKEETHKFIGFSHVRTPTKLSAKKKGHSKNDSSNNSGGTSGTGNASGNGTGNASNDPGISDNNPEHDSDFGPGINYRPKPMGVGVIDYKTHIFGSQVWTVENMRHFPDGRMTGVSLGSSDDVKYYEWSAAMNAEHKEESQGICASGWHIPTDADWKKLEGYLQMSKANQDKDNAYRGKDQASMLHQGRFNAELLGFFQSNNLKEEGNKAYFTSSTKSTKAGNFTGRKISTVPVFATRFILIRQVTFSEMAIGEVEVMYQGKNIALHKKTTAYESSPLPSKSSALSKFFSPTPSKTNVATGGNKDSQNDKIGPAPFVRANVDAIVDGKVSTGFLGNTYSNDGWIAIDLGAEYKIDSIKIKDLIRNSKRISAKELAIFTSKKAISTQKTLQELRVDPEVSSVGISIMRPSTDPDHNFIIAATTLDLWRGDIDNSIGSSVRCVQDDTTPALVATSTENNLQIGRPMKSPIRVFNLASGLINSWSIKPALNNGLAFDIKTGTISGTPNKLQNRTKYEVTATNDKGASPIAVYITISPIFVNSIEVSGKSVLKIGESIQLSATISPSDASNKTLSWLVDKAASIDSKTGKVTGLKEGIASIRAVSNSGLVVGRFEILVVNSRTVTINKKPYKIILSEATGKAWLDRNLGASRTCKTLKDASCYGNLYQWGRGNDGHQLKTYVKKTAILASSITPNHGNFIMNSATDTDSNGQMTANTEGGDNNSIITVTSPSNDWTAAGVDESGDKRIAAWSKTGVNNICPAGFKVPTSDELKAETEASTAAGKTGVNTLLKLPLSGNRNTKGKLKNLGQKGFYWTKSIVNPAPGKYLVDSLELDDSGNTSFLGKDRVQGFSVRCIKDIDSSAPIILPSTNQLNTQIGENITPITFANFGTDVTQWSISPMFYNGLSFDSHTGTISGKPNKVTPKAYYNITATNDFGTDTVTVGITINSVEVPVTNIQLSHNTMQVAGKNVLRVGETVQLNAEITPNNATIKDVLWKVKSDHAIISGSHGVATLTGISTGMAEVYATSLDGEYVVAKLTIHVINTVFKGKIYNTVVSPKTKRVWLDRNLGANQVCVDNNSSECYGGLYQFGRSTDGHQRRINTNMKRKQADSIQPSGNTFYTNQNQITSLTYETDPYNITVLEMQRLNYDDKIHASQKYDWTVADTEGSSRIKFWSNNKNGICPAGFEVPSIDELKAEMGYFSASSSTTVLQGFLKLPAAGKRRLYDGAIKSEGIEGYYWSKTPLQSHHTQSLVFSPASMKVYNDFSEDPNYYMDRQNLGNESPIEGFFADVGNFFTGNSSPIINKSVTGKSPVRTHTANANGYSIRCIKSEVMTAGGINYSAVKIAGQVWTINTMRHGDGTTPSYSSAKAGLTGKVYKYGAAVNYSEESNTQGICASGWHIPSKKDWNTLKEYISASHDKMASSLFPGVEAGVLKQGNHIILEEGNKHFFLWSSGYQKSISNVRSAQVRCIKDVEAMEVGGIQYKTVKIGAQVWTAENMRHISGSTNGVHSHNNDASNDKIYGKYYTWHAAMKGTIKEGAQGICALGWHIPTARDWRILQEYLGVNVAELNSNKASWRGTDQGKQLKVGGASGFGAIMTGIINNGTVQLFSKTIKQTYFWSSSQKSSDTSTSWKLALDLSKSEVYYGTAYKNSGASVRCIKNSEAEMETGGITYKTIKIGDQIWTAENMRHGTNSAENGIYSYDDKPSNDKLYGKIYTWSAAMKGATVEGSQGICAKNWRIATDNDWKKLESYLGMSKEFTNAENAWRGTDQGAQLKESSGIGFSSLLREGDGPFGVSALVASMWTSTSASDSSTAYSRTLEGGKGQIYRGANSKIFPLGVRCIKQQAMIDTNVALHQLTTQSSFRNNSHKAIDGITHGDYFKAGAGTSHTDSEKNPWWMVDLGKEYLIDKINIFNRTDCCQDRLDNYRVAISNNPGIHEPSYTHDFHGSPDPKKTIDLSRHHAKGRYVRITLLGDNKRVLSLAEVQVMVKENIFTITEDAKKALSARSINMALNKHTAQSAFGLSTSKRAVDGDTNGDYFHGSISVTGSSTHNTWWYVDLGEQVHIEKINIFNRTDCCKGRLKAYRVIVSDDEDFLQIKYVNEFHTVPDQKATIDLSEYKVIGRYVRIESIKLVGEESFLSLAEVQVMGVPAPD